MFERIDEPVEHREHITFAERHLETNMLVPVITHHARRKKTNRGMSRPRRGGENLEDLEKPINVLQLLHRLARKKIRRIETGRPIEPMSNLDPRHLAVEKLIEDPDEKLPVPLHIKPRAAKIKRHLFPRENHRRRCAHKGIVPKQENLVKPEP